MPFYNFKCTECGNVQEELVKMGTTETICKECAAPTEKTNSYMFASIGLPNGHIGIKKKS